MLFHIDLKHIRVIYEISSAKELIKTENAVEMTARLYCPEI
jgi:hypothetical protein